MSKLPKPLLKRPKDHHIELRGYAAVEPGANDKIEFKLGGAYNIIEVSSMEARQMGHWLYNWADWSDTKEVNVPQE